MKTTIELAALKKALDDLILEYHMERSSFARRVDEIFEQGLAAQPAQQEPGPACWQGEDGCPNRQACCDAQHCLYTTPPAAQPAPVQDKCFLCGERVESCTSTVCPKATPPAERRQWVGLTQEEIENCYGGEIDDFARAIEAKLKEKNT